VLTCYKLLKRVLFLLSCFILSGLSFLCGYARFLEFGIQLLLADKLAVITE